MAIQAIIADLGGVLIHQAQQAQQQDWEERSGISQRALFRLIDKAGLDREATLGKISSAEVWKRIVEQTGWDEQALHELEKNFFEGEYLNRELMDFLQGLRGRYRMAILSNAWSDVRMALESKFKLSQYFDVQVFSCEVGLAKPDTRIYQLVLHRLKLQPDETIFIDNNIMNVDAARVVGIPSIHYQGNEQTIGEIKKALEKVGRNRV